MERSKVRSRSDHDVAHLHTLSNVPTKYQLHTPYGFRDTGRKISSRRPSGRVCVVKDNVLKDIFSNLKKNSDQINKLADQRKIIKNACSN